MRKQQIWIDKLECYLKRQDFYQQSRCHCCCVYILCNRSKYNRDLEHEMRRNYRNHRSLLQYKSATSLTLCHTLRMGLQLKLLVIGVFLAFALSFCEARNATVKVVGLIHCTDCIKNQPSSSNASSSGLDVFIICKATKSEAKTEGNGAINKEGKFSVTLSAMTEDPSSIDGCYAKLQGKSGAPCPIQSNQTASVKIVSNFAPKRVMNRPTVIKFSPITCQSAIFWPFPNLTFFSSPPPPPDYTPPPPPEDLDFPPLASPVQPPLPPPENSTPPLPSPSYDPPAPEFGAPSPPPELSSGSPPPAPEFEAPSPQPELSLGSPPPAPPPTYQSPPSPTIQSPSPPPQAPPSRPQAPPVIDPIRAPTPTPTLSGPPPQEKAIQPPPSAAISRPPSRRKPSPIPRAPPIPRLPLTPGAPRQYFNAPKSKSKPPRFT